MNELAHGQHAHHASSRERLLAVDPKRGRSGEWTERLVDELRAALPGKRTLIEQELDASSSADHERARATPGRRTLVREFHEAGVTETLTTIVGLGSSVLDDFRSRGLRDVLTALAAMRGKRGVMQAARTAASRAMRAELASQTGRPAPPDPCGQAMWHAAERRGATLYRRAVEGSARREAPAVTEALQRIGGGRALEADVRRAMERELGVPLDRVRIHTDAVAADAARAVCAEAFTVGEDIFFAEHSFAPETERGARLLVHELTHVVQAWQQRTSADGQGARISNPNDHLEQEATAAEERLGEPRSQQHGTATEDREGDIHAAAVLGISGRADALPFLDVIQPLFGRHDLRGVRAHHDAAARAGGERMGALAFASGDDIAFATRPTLEIVAHEAAHVVQQRAGVQLRSRVGEADDIHERHADAVAAHVVAGASAESLLDSFVGGSSSLQPVIQRATVVPKGLPNDSVEYGRLTDNLKDVLRPNSHVNDKIDSLLLQLEKNSNNTGNGKGYMVGVAECIDGRFVAAKSGGDTDEFRQAVHIAMPFASIAPYIKVERKGDDASRTFRTLRNFKGKTKEYEVTDEKSPGDCAAPKIINWAQGQLERAPIALVEKWFGPDPEGSAYSHGDTVAPCWVPCDRDLLPFMLKGRARAVAEAEARIATQAEAARTHANTEKNKQNQKQRQLAKKAAAGLPDLLKVQLERLNRIFESEEREDCLEVIELFRAIKLDEAVRMSAELLGTIRFEHIDFYASVQSTIETLRERCPDNSNVKGKDVKGKDVKGKDVKGKGKNVNDKGPGDRNRGEEKSKKQGREGIEHSAVITMWPPLVALLVVIVAIVLFGMWGR